MNIATDYPQLNDVPAVQILSMDTKLRVQYYFRSACNYYCYLFLTFLINKPRVARCQCCGKYFIPKTKKATLYCDRKIKNGKTCKQIAPHLKHKISVDKDEVLKLFDQVKQKMYKRYERQSYSDSDLPHGLTAEEYSKWIAKATAARDDYILGKITAEEAMLLINTED